MQKERKIFNVPDRSPVLFEKMCCRTENPEPLPDGGRGRRSPTGQNALNQAKLFKESTDVTGIVLTKLDGTARGGIVLAIRNELHLPVKYVGLGEKVDDLQKFDAGDFVYGLFKGLVEVD